MSTRSPQRTVLASLAALLVGGGLAACGASTANEAQGNQATGTFPASVQASFPSKQRLAEAAQLVIRVKNTGSETMPNVAVTLTNPKYGNGAQALGTLLALSAPGQPVLAGRSRPVWVIDRGPGPCGYACKTGGDGGAGTTAYNNTWALGPLAPGATETFDWHVTAIQPGTYTVAYRVAGGLSSKAPASGSTTAGALHVLISEAPRQGSINAQGQPVESNGG